MTTTHTYTNTHTHTHTHTHTPRAGPPVNAVTPRRTGGPPDCLLVAPGGRQTALSDACSEETPPDLARERHLGGMPFTPGEGQLVTKVSNSPPNRGRTRLPSRPHNR